MPFAINTNNANNVKDAFGDLLSTPKHAASAEYYCSCPVGRSSIAEAAAASADSAAFASAAQSMASMLN